jgi:hypothetical protein
MNEAQKEIKRLLNRALRLAEGENTVGSQVIASKIQLALEELVNQDAFGVVSGAGDEARVARAAAEIDGTAAWARKLAVGCNCLVGVRRQNCPVHGVAKGARS